MTAPNRHFSWGLLKHRRWRVLLIGAIALLFLTLTLAPQRGNQLLRGSTYGRAPDGYGAWYQYMEDQGTPIQRWQKPLNTFLARQAEPGPGADRPITLLQVGSSEIWADDEAREREALQAWLAQGNRLVVLQRRGEVTAAPFRTDLATPLGEVRIETRRRHRVLENIPQQPGAIEARRNLGGNSQASSRHSSRDSSRDSSRLDFVQNRPDAPPPNRRFEPMPGREAEAAGTVTLLADDFGAIAGPRARTRAAALKW
ncbi:MAG: DUF4350 domain-containing protein [Synechococcales cyanobacterium RM1_1_8]|nr:DUF4350 domain-containing protein [Synechococcales cyanobacterium RM1_1_8]